MILSRLVCCGSGVELWRLGGMKGLRGCGVVGSVVGVGRVPEREREKMRKVRLTKRRLEVIVSALAYWETILKDDKCGLWESEAEYREYRQQEHEREQAFIWAHQELAKRNTVRK